MDWNMGNSKSLLLVDNVEITDRLALRIPSVGEVLEDEQTYYSLVYSLTASPMQYMVQLDDMGVDYTKVSDYELFLMLFPAFAKENTTFLFGDLDLSDATVMGIEGELPFILCQHSDIMIDISVYLKLAQMLRKINLLKKDNSKPGNEAARKYLLEKERKRLKRRSKKPYDPYLEKLVIALVNTSEFPYDYDSCMDLSIYRFNKSLEQIQRKINFDNTMTGVYAGTIDTKKMGNKDGLSWIPISN